MQVRWQIGREGRTWAKDEAMERWQMTPERLEMVDGKLLWDEESRVSLLALLLENVGADRAVRLGDPATWMEAVEGLRLEGTILSGAPPKDSELPLGAEHLPVERQACAALLGRLMADYSEDYWAAGWLVDLEFELWQAVTGAKTWISETEVAGLRYLSKACGGWIAFHAGPPYRRYVPMREWSQQYEGWLKRRAVDETG